MKINLPENINLAQAGRYILTICIRPEGFSFSLYNPVENGSFFFREIENEDHKGTLSNFREYFYQNDFWTLPFRKIFLMDYTSCFTYVPSLICEENSSRDFMSFLFTEKTGEKTMCQRLMLSDLTILYQLEEANYEFFHRTFVGIRFIHYTSPFIAYFHERSKITRRSQMIINLSFAGMDIFCFREGKFLLGNRFKFAQWSDALYYILFSWKQLKLDQLTDFLYVTGEKELKKEAIESLKLYIYNIIPVNITPEAHFEGIDMGSIPFELTALTLCEL